MVWIDHPIDPYVVGSDPWVKSFVDFITPLCDNGEIKVDTLLEITGWPRLLTPWGYDLPFFYIYKADGHMYLTLKELT